MSIELHVPTDWTEGRGFDCASRGDRGLAGLGFAAWMLVAGTSAPLTHPHTSDALDNCWTSQPDIGLIFTGLNLPGTPVDRRVSSWTELRPLLVVPSHRVASTGEQVVRLHEVSGLTWDQLARLFGVSRRAIHNWAAGSKLSARNEEALGQVGALLEERRDFPPAENRTWLLKGRPGGRSIFDELRCRFTARVPVEDVLTLRERLGLA